MQSFALYNLQFIAGRNYQNKEYVDKECMNYWSISQNPEGNMIAYSSWKFYNSKDLDNFIHKTLRKNIGNYER